ncbi:polysaccharide biosynthesis protein [Bacterioplanoides sp.]|uniref:polysaccharide biosynthesis protein n=1 Tax=Bacterioplanoides sp. TaxID=2066072 RepID=UPI003AFFBBF9
MLQKLLESKRSIKRLITLTYDALAIPLAIYIALALRHGDVFPAFNEGVIISAVITTLITLGIFIRLGFYRAVIRFMTSKAFSSLGVGILISATTLGTSSFLTQALLPRSSVIIYIFTAFALLALPRLFIRSLVQQQGRSDAEPVILYGAGQQGLELSHSLAANKDYRPIAFIDDCKKKQGTQINGLKVYSYDSIDEILEDRPCKKILLALGNTSFAKRKQLIEKLSLKKVEVLTTPAVADIVSGKAKIEEIRDVEIEDLLGRDPVSPHNELISRNITNKVVLVTGAGGSIGSELCRQAIKQKPTTLILFELNEFSLYSIEQELTRINEEKGLGVKLISILGSVQRQNRLEMIFKTFNVQTIYHAAAYKHVPLVEHNVVEGVRNNVFGTWYCAEAAIAAGVERFVLVSTDKAVRPTNVMGTSKRLAELVLQALNERQSETLFCMVRFGNVLGSSGSVVPLFRKQIKAGGPITVTHPDIIRYFMTIPEASQLVIQAGAMGKGGDVFVLDMGEPVKITNLAKKMIQLSGLTEKTEEDPNGDIEINFSGLRPGEKLYEELLIGDNVEGTTHSRIMTANEIFLSWPETHNLLHRLDLACHDFRVDDVIKLLLEAPAAYNKQDDCPDWVMNAGNK